MEDHHSSSNALVNIKTLNSNNGSIFMYSYGETLFVIKEDAMIEKWDINDNIIEKWDVGSNTPPSPYGFHISDMCMPNKPPTSKN